MDIERHDHFRMNMGNGLILHECPISFIDLETRSLVDLFWDCHSGQGTGYGTNVVRHSLPEAGGVLDQDNKTLEAFLHIQPEAVNVLNQKKTEKEK